MSETKYLAISCLDCRTRIDDIDDAFAGLLCESCARKHNQDVCLACKGHGAVWIWDTDRLGTPIQRKAMCVVCAGAGVRQCA